MLPRDPKPSSSRKKIVWAIVLVWGLVIIGLVFWIGVGIQKTFTPRVSLPYTVFLNQLRANNIARIRISGAAISGDFVKPYLWPKGGPGRSSSPKVPSPLISEFPQLAAQAPRAYTEFQTVFPEELGDPGLLAQLEAHNVEIEAVHPWHEVGVGLIGIFVPLILFTGLILWMGRHGSRGQPSPFGFGQTKARQYTSEQIQIRFTDVAGAVEAKTDLQEEVDFLCRPDKYHEMGARIPRGILLVGPPGTGKTLLARAVAGEAGVPFFHLSASEFVEVYVGVGASRVRDLFAEAKEAAPSIVFIDELDAVGRTRGGGYSGGNSEREQTLNQLLVEMDGFEERQEVIILGATNRPDVLDPALLRPGRFDRRVFVGLPDRRDREGILRIHTRKLHLAPDMDLALLARKTIGFSGADLANLCNEAALIATRRNLTLVTPADFDAAHDKVIFGGARTVLMDSHDRRVVAYHEAGHAIVAWLTAAADPVSKVTIVPHGQALGLTAQLPEEDHYNCSRSYLMARLSVMLGGRTAEEIALGEITTGAERDLVEATRLARRMVMNWGMGNLGLVAFPNDEAGPGSGTDSFARMEYSEATAARIDGEIVTLLEDRHRIVRELLTGVRDKLEALVEALLHEESIDRDVVARILGPRLDLGI